MNNTELTLDQLAEVAGGDMFQQTLEANTRFFGEIDNAMSVIDSDENQIEEIGCMKIDKVNASKNPLGYLLCLPACD